MSETSAPPPGANLPDPPPLPGAGPQPDPITHAQGSLSLQPQASGAEIPAGWRPPTVRRDLEAAKLAVIDLLQANRAHAAEVERRLVAIMQNLQNR